MSGKEEAVSLDDDQTTDIILIAKDQKSIKVTRKASNISGLIKSALESDSSATEVPVDVRYEILALVTEYMTFHEGTEPSIIEKPLKSKIMREVCKDVRDAEFIDNVGTDKQKLFDLILTANYLDIKGLLHLGCAKVAAEIKGQPLEKIKEILGTGSK